MRSRTTAALCLLLHGSALQREPHLVPDDVAVHGCGDAFVDEAKFRIEWQQPEMVGVMRKPPADALGRRPLGGRIRRRLDRTECLSVIFRCMPDVYEICLLKAVPSKGGWEAPFCNAQNPDQQYK